MKPIRLNPNSIFETERQLMQVVIANNVETDSNNQTLVAVSTAYDTMELFTVNASVVKIFSIGSFHKLSFVVTGTCLLEIGATSQTIDNTNYDLPYSALNTQIVKITVSANSSVNGVISKV